jgi:cytochrome c oxidase assembly protein subunit 11
MTVVFYVDPKIVEDRDQDPLNTITLSYTFYRLPDAERPVAEAPDKTASKL